MIRQLRTFYTADQLAQVYATQYDHTRWDDHIERIAHTTAHLDKFAAATVASSVADLSCGDGAIVLGSRWPWQRVVLSDYTGGPRLTDRGPIEETLGRLEPVDVFVCSETLEHVEQPGYLLKTIRLKTKHLLLTTPIGEVGSGNPEHYWGWDEEGVEELLDAAGFTERWHEAWKPEAGSPYIFQIWRCS